MTTAQSEITAKRTALLVMDMQNRIVANYASDPGLLGRLQGAIAAARKANVKVIHVVLGLRAGTAEASQRNTAFSAAASAGAFIESDQGRAIHAQMAPAQDDVIVTKRRVGAFAGSDLDLVLRANDIDTLVLCGIATSGVVLSTLRHASDLDFRLLVLSDGCVDSDEEVHRVLITKVFPRQAAVITVSDWETLARQAI